MTRGISWLQKSSINLRTAIMTSVIFMENTQSGYYAIHLNVNWYFTIFACLRNTVVGLAAGLGTVFLGLVLGSGSALVSS